MKGRIALAIVGSVIATLTLFGVPLGWAIEAAYKDDLRLRLESAALAASPELSERNANVIPAEPPLQREGIRIAFYDAAGHLVAGRGPSTADTVVRAALAGRNGLAERSVAVPVYQDDRVIGVVRSEEDHGLLTARIHRAWLLMGALALLVVLAVVALAASLARRLTRPVHELAVAASRLEQGDFAVAPAPSGIAEIDRAGLALASAAQRLEGVLARERALTSDVTHQLKTPLTALRLELEGGAERSTGPDSAAALAQVDRLEQTIASILALARDLDTAREPIAVADVLESVRKGWRRDAHTAGRSLTVSVAPPDLSARISDRGLHQIVDVLIDNALHHGSGRIQLRARQAAGDVEIDVTDEGTAPFDADAIFARRSPSARGHGIGLALARSLAEADGGRLTATSGPDGTTFSLLLLGDEADDANPAEAGPADTPRRW